MMNTYTISYYNDAPGGLSYTSEDKGYGLYGRYHVEARGAMHAREVAAKREAARRGLRARCTCSLHCEVSIEIPTWTIFGTRIRYDATFYEVE